MENGDNPFLRFFGANEFWRKNEFYFLAVSPEQNPNFFPNQSD